MMGLLDRLCFLVSVEENDVFSDDVCSLYEIVLMREVGKEVHIKSYNGLVLQSAEEIMQEARSSLFSFYERLVVLSIILSMYEYVSPKKLLDKLLPKLF
jgi:hypothetical protein